MPEAVTTTTTRRKLGICPDCSNRGRTVVWYSDDVTMCKCDRCGKRWEVDHAAQKARREAKACDSAGGAA